MVALDATTISVALPRIAQDLHGTGIQAFWYGYLSFDLLYNDLTPSKTGLARRSSLLLPSSNLIMPLSRIYSAANHLSFC